MRIKGICKTTALMTMLLMQSALKADVLPGSVLPEQVSRSLKQQQPSAVSNVPATIATPKEEAKPPGGEQAKKIKFELNDIILVGNHIYSDQVLQKIYKDKLHKQISVADLFAIVQSITNYYRNNGYVISRAVLPPQHVKGGVVRVQVIEGFLDQVEVTGKPKGAKCLVKAFGNQIKRCPPLQLKRMEKYLLLANEIPGADVKAVLAPSKKVTGAADLSLVTAFKFNSGYLSSDNYGTRYIGPQQNTFNLGFNSIFGSGDLAQFTVTKTPKGGELTYGDFNYTFPANDEGSRWLFGATRTQTHPLFVLRIAQIDGLTTNLYTTLSFPFIRTRTQSLSFQVNANYLDSYVTVFSQKLYTDHLRPIGLGVTYSFSDKYLGSNLIYADIRQGLPIFGYTSDTNPLTAETSRPGGHGDFTKYDFQYSRLQVIKGPLALYALAKAQWAWSALLASEQFTFGGPQIGRGYDVAEFIGDSGFAASLELRYDWAIGKLGLQVLQPYVFYEGGAIWNWATSPTIIRKLSGTSGGIGTRFYFTKTLSGNFTWTQTFTKPVAAEELIGRGRLPRVWFSIVASL